MKRHPRSENAWRLKGSGLGFLDKHKETLMCFDTALNIDQNYVDAWCNKDIIRHEIC